MKILVPVIAFIFLLASCGKKDEDYCPETLHLTASNLTPTVGEDLTIDAYNGACIYNWVGPQNFAIQKEDGSDKLMFTNI